MGFYTFLLTLVSLLVVSTAATATDSKKPKDSKDYVTEVMLTFRLFGVEISTQQKIMGNLTRLIEHIQEVNIKGIIILWRRTFLVLEYLYLCLLHSGIPKFILDKLALEN